ncbi:serine hydrolase domain-containing protein [Paremcibacter congregatus]|uniref:serine hydrolase domain-containing protein n=1 Tax=Paremcibacter congregatus TaxID=2043170 RepID=UPI0030ECE543
MRWPCFLSSLGVILGITPACAAPGGALEGRLTLDVTTARLETRVLQDDFHLAQDPDTGRNRIPAFSFAYIQDGAALLPVKAGAIPGNHPVWEWVLTAGALKRDDKGLHASLPVALMEKNENCLHNGVLEFTIIPDGQTTKARLRIASETCPYFKFDMLGDLPARWHPEQQPGAAAVQQIFQREKSTYLPQKPVAALKDAHPDLALAGLSESKRIAPSDISQFGVLMAGVHYAGGCMTRAGLYPHCDQMAVPSYSLAKSLVAGLALMRLEKLYPGAADEKIAAYVPACQGAAWRGVTFRDTLSMATGNYTTAGADADESSETYQAFFQTRTHRQKINFACHHFPHKATPGTQFAYHTSDTYILGAALQAFWQEKKGAEHDFFNDLIVRDIFAPLGLSPSAQWTRRSLDREAQPFTGWGLILTRQDIAKLLSFLGGQHKDLHPSDLLSSSLFQAALQKKTADRGLLAGHPENKIRYSNGFWAYNAQDDLSCRSETWLPFLSGYGGLSAVLLPDGGGYYMISDGGQHAFMAAVTQLHHLNSLCGGDPE